MIDWSYSRTWLWRTCPRQYWLRHLSGEKPTQAEAEHRQRGIMIHAGLEAAFRAVLDGSPAFGISPKVTATMSGYARYAFEAMNEVASTAVNAMTGATGVAHARATSDVAAVLASLPTPRREAILGVEWSLSAEVDSGVRVRAVLDYVLLTGAHRAHIRDWKSGNAGSTATEPTPQTLLYAHLLYTVRPDLHTISVGLYNTRNRQETIFEVDREQAAVGALGVIGAAYDAQDAAQRAEQSPPPGAHYPARPGPHCGSCAHRSLCPLFADAPLPTVITEEDLRLAQDRVRTALEEPDIAAYRRHYVHPAEGV